jgi:hypothetical protein
MRNPYVRAGRSDIPNEPNNMLSSDNDTMNKGGLKKSGIA